MTSLTDTSLKWYNENQKVEWGRFHSILHPVQELLDHAWPLLVTVMYWLDIAIRMHFRDAKWCSCKNQEKGERDSNGEKLGGRFYPINIRSNKYTVQALGHATALPWCGKSYQTLAFPCQNIFLPATLPSLSLSALSIRVTVHLATCGGEPFLEVHGVRHTKTLAGKLSEVTSNWPPHLRNSLLFGFSLKCQREMYWGICHTILRVVSQAGGCSAGTLKS